MSDDPRVELRALSANDRDEFVEAMLRGRKGGKASSSSS